MAAPAFAQCPQPSTEEWLERIIARLLDAEMHEGNPHLAADHRQARMTVALVRKGDAIPFISACYDMYGCHPDQIWPRMVANREARLGREFPHWYHEDGTLKPDRIIPDWDYSCGLPPVFPDEEPRQESPALSDGRKWRKAPARLVVSRTRVPGEVFYEEVLECGHTYFDYLGGWIGGNPKKRRRRCRECQNQNPEKKPVRSVNAEDVARIRIRFA